jgi:hypothetical protein
LRQWNRSSFRPLADLSLENPNVHRRILFAGHGKNSIRGSGNYFLRCVFVGRGAGRIAGKNRTSPGFPPLQPAGGKFR